MQKSDSGTYILLAVLLLGGYLLYKSLANLGASISGIGTSATGYVSGIGSTLQSELTGVANIPTNLYNSLGSIGTTAGQDVTSALNWGSSFLGTSPSSSDLSFLDSPYLDSGFSMDTSNLPSNSTSYDFSNLNDNLLTPGIGGLQSPSYVNGDTTTPVDILNMDPGAYASDGQLPQ
jgi:hypothetical protein